jgi:two-component system sensor histidine kinase HydH
MSHKERLTSLGRLSTVIAHEVRNPLMIIKGSLHALRQKNLDETAMHEAVHDIDEEVERLNRIVNEVLDFARPIKFDVASADINDVCRGSAAASQAAGAGATMARVLLDLDPAAGPLVTDAERLRIALVNMLVNARHAGGDVTLRTRTNGEHVSIVIADTGRGIEPDHLAHVFDPYFTTKRGGTGLGLPIAKNIIEGLGGTITIDSTPGAGTEIRIDLPYNAQT